LICDTVIVKIATQLE